MLGLMGAPQQPIDFTMATDETVLDLRKIKAENNEYRSNQETSVIRSPNFQTPASPPLGCYPPPSYYQQNYHPLQTQQFHFHRESSEDGSERGSISPPSISSPTSVTAPYSITSSIISGNITRGGKPTRPFKAYPKDPLALPVVSTGEALIGHRSNEAYAEFRRKMLSQVQAVTSTNSTNSKMKRSASPTQLSQQPSSCSDQDSKDAAYWERRRKNNEAAKRSRDARRAKEDEIAIRAAFLEQENFQLKYENATLRNEAAKLRCLLYDR